MWLTADSLHPPSSDGWLSSRRYVASHSNLNMNRIILILLIVLLSCNSNSKSSNEAESKTEKNENRIEVEKTGNTIKSRINPPHGFKRIQPDLNSFEEYLQNLNLKPKGSKVKYYSGSTKFNDNIYTDVIDLKIGNKNLHHCADAIIRLRSEFLWAQQKYDEIIFNFTNGQKVEYSKWKDGYRIDIEGNKTWWVKKENPSNTYEDFWNYLEQIFMYPGTASLEKELRKKNIKNAEIGNILIQGGSPGHAIIIVDKAINDKDNKKLYLLAQSYMPAQEIQILVNPNNSDISPWYDLEKNPIVTPEWTFSNTDLKEFE